MERANEIHTVTEFELLTRILGTVSNLVVRLVKVYLAAEAFHLCHITRLASDRQLRLSWPELTAQ